MDEIIKLSDTIIHLEQGMIRQNTTPAQFFLNGSNAITLTGNIVSMEVSGTKNIAVILINNRMMKINLTEGNTNVTIGEKVEIVYENDIPVIRKL